MTGPHLLFIPPPSSRSSKSSKHDGTPLSPNPPDICPMSVQSAVKLQGGRGPDSLSTQNLSPDPPQCTNCRYRFGMKNELHHVCKKKKRKKRRRRDYFSFFGICCYFFCTFCFYCSTCTIMFYVVISERVSSQDAEGDRQRMLVVQMNLRAVTIRPLFTQQCYSSDNYLL